jgi:hypothetical protein
MHYAYVNHESHEVLSLFDYIKVLPDSRQVLNDHVISV